MDTIVVGKLALTDPQNDPQLNEDTAFLVRDDKIVRVGRLADVTIGLDDRSYSPMTFDLVIPGFINSHHHVYGLSPLQQGCLDESLELWLLALGKIPSLNDRLATMASSISQLKSGVTTLVHSDGPSSGQSYETVIRERLEGYKATGQRVAFAVGYADQNNLVYAPDKDFIASLPADLTSEIKNHLTSSPPPTLVEYEGLFDRTFHWLKGKAPSRMRLLAGPLSPIWCSPEALEMTGEICKRHDTGLHTHLLESIYQRHYAKTILGKSMVSYLASLSLLGPLSSFAHGVWVSRNDIGLLGESGSTIVHNPSSNLRLRNGIAPVIPMLREGVSVALGQDATSLDDDDDFFKK